MTHLRELGTKALRGLRRNGPVLLFGAVGGLLFVYLRMPLAWMLGSMFFTAALALTGTLKRYSLNVDTDLRAVMITVVGVLLGSAFTPEMLAKGQEMLALIGIMLLYIPIATVGGYFLFTRIGKIDPTTAYFAAAPGGLQEMTLVGEEMGANPRTIVLIHAMRVFVVVMTIPLYFRLIEKVNMPTVAPGAHINELLLKDGLILIACGLVGWIVASRLRIPAARLIGPMVCSAAVHLAGFSTAKPPPELVALAQVVMGGALGCRFAGAALSDLARLAKLSLGATFLMICLTLGVVFGFAPMLGMSREALTLVFAPGGLVEMSLVALALGVEVATVASMHVARIAIVVILAPLTFRLIGIRRAQE